MGTQENDKCCKDGVKIAAYLLVGFCLYLDLWIGVNGATFSLKRFQLSEDLFSIYVSKVYSIMGVGYFFGGSIGTVYFLVGECHKEYVSIGLNWLFFIINFALLIVFVTGGDNGNVTLFYWLLCISAIVYGLIEQFVFVIADKCLIWYLATLDTSPIFTAFLHFIMLKMVGNRRKYDTDFIVLTTQIGISVLIILGLAIVWSIAYCNGGATQQQSEESQSNGCNGDNDSSDSASEGFEWKVLSPMAMCTIGQGIVYAVYPGIAPGMLIHFKYVNIIDQVLLIMAPFPAIIVAVISKWDKTEGSGPGNKWKNGLSWWHSTHIFSITEVVCAYLFIHSLHFPNSSIGIKFVNKPGTTGFVTVVFFTCYMVLMVVGYTGVEENCGKAYKSSIPTVNLFISCSTMMVLVFLGEGYISEFQKYERINWPTIGMSNRKAFNYWMYKSYKNAVVNIRHLFTLDLRRDLLFSFETIDLI